MDDVAIVVGTRPEIIKMAPIVRAFQRKEIPFKLIHTGQHYDYELSKMIVQELGLPKPNHSFKLENIRPAAQIGEMIVKLEQVLKKVKPKALLIQGDTNTMLASALTGVKLGLPVGHVEAGLRSYDWRMPEEHNRRMVDHISDLLFAPTDLTRRNLENEKVYGKIFVTGNTVIDATKQHMSVAEKKSTIMKKVRFDNYALVTFHRAENVDNVKVLKNFTEVIVKAPLSVVFPVHPRTKKRLSQLNLWRKLTSSEKVQLTPPLGYLDLLILMKNCKFILTDSGGLQEEATAPQIKKFVLVLRLSTERPEAVEAGFAKIVGVEKHVILNNVDEILNSLPRLPNKSPFGDGKASERIAEIVKTTI